jgi:hypothetical protein
MLRTMCLGCWLALLVGLLVIGPGRAGAEDNPDVRQACTPDALRLCSDVIPDVPKITRCMMRNYRQLSQECRVAMAHGHRATTHRRRYYRAHK